MPRVPIQILLLLFTLLSTNHCTKSALELFENHIFEFHKIESLDNEPSLQKGDYVLIRKYDLSFKRGDLIYYKGDDPEGLPNRIYFHRIIGLPGDKISYWYESYNGWDFLRFRTNEKTNELVYQNEILDQDRFDFDLTGREKLEEWIGVRKYYIFGNYANYHQKDEFYSLKQEIILKDKEYFVIGDLRSASFDSRHKGPIKRENIIGKPSFIYFSINWKDNTCREVLNEEATECPTNFGTRLLRSHLRVKNIGSPM
ncbi:signal peptidase I [Leptospira sarikeiensis]|uniref:Signal peptidase I n=1 Tax=Leptospira sarikeiensis TaxID=2484943 RepID=A0A4R9K2G6_9LEPT|nr:signal peptidase I [Leptospira sarikeiensis]TGL59050.1 signal peptidase I [Leptospira sarikeiensis]